MRRMPIVGPPAATALDQLWARGDRLFQKAWERYLIIK